VVEAPGVALGRQRFQKSARRRVFPVKLLMQGTFDVFIDSPGFFSVPPKSTQFLEPLWRRREPVPGARASGGVPPPPSHTAAVRLAAECEWLLRCVVSPALNKAGPFCGGMTAPTQSSCCRPH